ncbi:lipopolysaccharide biosynthesis protein [Neobacillus thermocopriae]|uniref:lipopolysaccharide biosynthesis protein n=1 Tax=Neobacillus thermocopriae TaxID=1215031 RepID=UPI00376F82F6
MKLRLWVKKVKDYGINVSAFGIYILMQQLVIMPILARLTNDTSFSNIILFISIFNIVCIFLGDELGNTRIVRANIYQSKKIHGDFHAILSLIIILLVLICTLANYFVNFNWLNMYLYLAIIILGIIRYFSMSFFRLKLKFHNILYMNILYGIGAVLGLIFATNGYYLAPFLLGEIISNLFVFFLVLKEKDHRPTLALTPEFNNTIGTFANLSIISIVVNTLAYLDRILIFPVLGASAMAIYFSASAMSKMVSLIINPISGVILAKLTRVRNEKRVEVIKVVTKYLLPSILLFSVGSIIVSYFGVKIFYNKYFYDALPLIVPIGLATAFSLASFLLKPFLISFFKTKELMFIHLFYAVVFCISMYFFSFWWGIIGFAWSTSFARLTQLLFYFLIIIKGKMVEGEEYVSNGNDTNK